MYSLQPILTIILSLHTPLVQYLVLKLRHSVCQVSKFWNKVLSQIILYSRYSITKEFCLNAINFSHVYIKALKRGNDFRFYAKHGVKPVLDRAEVLGNEI